MPTGVACVWKSVTDVNNYIICKLNGSHSQIDVHVQAAAGFIFEEICMYLWKISFTFNVFCQNVGVSAQVAPSLVAPALVAPALVAPAQVAPALVAPALVAPAL